MSPTLLILTEVKRADPLLVPAVSNGGIAGRWLHEEFHYLHKQGHGPHYGFVRKQAPSATWLAMAPSAFLQGCPRVPSPNCKTESSPSRRFQLERACARRRYPSKLQEVHSA